MNVFVSRPTVIGPNCEAAYGAFHNLLVSQGFVVRRLGGGDYSKKPPLRAVIDLIKECCGALILGYPQLEFQHRALRSTKLQNNFQCVYPTPWNQIEGALAYACESPVLVIAHPGIDGGVFDHGITGEGVLHIDLGEPDWFRKAQFTQPFREWVAEVQVCSKRRLDSAGEGKIADFHDLP
jgi:hypothetical protein